MLGTATPKHPTCSAAKEPGELGAKDGAAIRSVGDGNSGYFGVKRIFVL
jgi:hypothetical protein